LESRRSKSAGVIAIIVVADVGSVMDTAGARGGTESELGEDVIWGTLHISLIASPVRGLTVSFDGGG